MPLDQRGPRCAPPVSGEGLGGGAASGACGEARPDFDAPRQPSHSNTPPMAVSTVPAPRARCAQRLQDIARGGGGRTENRADGEMIWR